MKTIVGDIGIFTKADFPGLDCPRCKGDTVLLSTTNKYCYWCKSCDIRFTDKGLVYSSVVD